MADTVRQLMEAMVPELQALEAAGYFSRTEVLQIAMRRQDHEYALKRRAAVKVDYLRAIEYEMQLEELRRHRRAAARAHAEASTTLSDATMLAKHCIVRRVHFIYDRATRKFREDLALWAAWLHFCHASGSARQMSRVLSRTLRLHPTASALWTYAAAWEFEHNLDAGAARALMQRGLRLCSSSAAAEPLWHEYFRMELLYAARLRQRRHVLGIEGMDADELVADGLASSGEPSTVAVQAVLNGAVAQMVFKNAIAAVPGSLSFRAKFLDMLQLFEDFPGKTHLEDVIYRSIQRDFARCPEAQDLLARRQASNPLTLPALLATLRAYSNAVEALPCAQMRQLVIEFLIEQLDTAIGLGNAAASELLAQALEQAYTEALKAGQFSEQVALGSVRLQLHAQDLAGALSAAQHAAQLLPQSAAIQQLSLRLEVAAALPQETGDFVAHDTAELTVDGTAMLAAGSGAVGTSRLQACDGIACAGAVHAMAEWGGVAAARTLYQELLHQQRPAAELFHAALDVELLSAAAADNTALAPGQIRALFEAATDAHGRHDVELWLRWLHWEAAQGSSCGGNMHRRAVKALADPTMFVAACQQLGLPY